MTDAEILRLLASLGIDDLSYQALPLLPLLQVAWADGEIQEAERQLVEEILASRGLGPEATRLVHNWLTYPPTAAYLERGRTALVALAKRGGDFELEPDVLHDVLALAREVAKSDGGLWGLGAVSRQEKDVLAQIARALDVADGEAWQDAVHSELAKDSGRQRVLIKFNTDTLDLGAMPGVLTPAGSPDVQIPVEGTLVLGADPECEVVVSDHDVDDRHCEVRAERGRFYVKDYGRGTFVDGEQIVERRLLGGETVRLGSSELKFQLLRRVPDQML